jgi:hypothetical protein
LLKIHTVALRKNYNLNKIRFNDLVKR